MASSRRNTIRIKFIRIPSKLEELVSKVLDNSQFTKRHGHLLSMVTSGFQEDIMSIIFQFVDQKYHCFTFLDYQLVPTMEELSKLLEVPILDQIPFTGLEQVPKPEDVTVALHLKRSDIITNWKTRNEVKGFSPKFLMEKTQWFLDAMNFCAFEDMLALLIYGLVLFPNPDQFIDVNAIKIFLTHNSVPTLLGDFLHSLHTRTMKKR